MEKRDSSSHLSEIVTSCSNCKLSGLCLPQGLVTSELTELQTIVKQLPVTNREKTIFLQGDRFKHLYILRAGCAKVYSTNSMGVEQVMSFTLPGELLGIDAIASGQHPTSASALGTASLCRMEFEKFEELCLRIPKLSKHILKVIGQELVTEHDVRTALSQKTTGERIAVFIISLSTRFRLLGYSGTQFIFPMPRSDIANYLGMSAETVSRKFKELRNDGIISVNQREIKINDMDYLKTQAGHCDSCPTAHMAVNGN